jgi:hypothetical protein
MPDKNYLPNCGKGCSRCWRNKLKHANKLKKKQFPKQNIWNIPSNISRISNDDSSDEEDYSSNIEEYVDSQIKTRDDFPSYKLKNIEFKIYTLLYIYEHYNTWLSETKQLFEPSIKHFKTEFKKHIPLYIIKNDTFDLKSME